MASRSTSSTSRTPAPWNPVRRIGIPRDPTAPVIPSKPELVQGGEDAGFQPLSFTEATEPQHDPTQDPTYLAFQRALQVQEDNMRAEIAANLAEARRNVDRQLPGLEDQRKRGLQDIEFGHAGRGTWSSSQRLRDQDRFASSIDTQRSNLQSGLADTEGSLQQRLARAIAANKASLAEQTTPAVGRLRDAWAEQQADRRATFDTAEGERRRRQMEVNERIRTFRPRTAA